MHAFSYPLAYVLAGNTANNIARHGGARTGVQRKLLLSAKKSAAATAGEMQREGQFRALSI